MNPSRITIYRDSAGQYRWRMQARNGRIIADSAEGYASRRNAIRAAETVRATLPWTVIL